MSVGVDRDMTTSRLQMSRGGEVAIKVVKQRSQNFLTVLLVKCGFERLNCDFSGTAPGSSLCVSRRKTRAVSLVIPIKTGKDITKIHPMPICYAPTIPCLRMPFGIAGDAIDI